MDETQKVLIKVGRKDLAQKYYKKIAQTNWRNIRRKIQRTVNDTFLGHEDIPRLEEEIKTCSFKLEQAKNIGENILKNKESIEIINNTLSEFGLYRHLVDINEIENAVKYVIFLLNVSISARQELIEEQKLFR